jgi:thiol-disulfide isomerase/thioredoxin
VSKKLSNHASLPKRFLTPVRIGLIGSALVLIVAIVAVFYHGNTGALNQAANSQSISSSSATPSAAASNVPNNATALMVPARVLEPSFPTLDSKPRRLADYAGKVLVVDIWATWCGPCRVEIPHLIELTKEYKARGVEVIGLTTEDPAKDTEKVRDFVKEFNINYPIGFANGEFALHLMQGRDVVPQTYVIGRNGRLHKHFVGFNAQTSPPQLRAAVAKAIAAEE